MVHMLTAGGPSSHPLPSTLAMGEYRQMLARCQHMDFELPNLQICEKQISALKITQSQIKHISALNFIPLSKNSTQKIPEITPKF